jgi:hypothetical protein
VKNAKRRIARRAKRKRLKSVPHLGSANNNSASQQTPPALPPSSVVLRLLGTVWHRDHLCCVPPTIRCHPRRS